MLTYDRGWSTKQENLWYIFFLFYVRCLKLIQFRLCVTCFRCIWISLVEGKVYAFERSTLICSFPGGSLVGSFSIVLTCGHFLYYMQVTPPDSYFVNFSLLHSLNFRPSAQQSSLPLSHRAVCSCLPLLSSLQ